MNDNIPMIDIELRENDLISHMNPMSHQCYSRILLRMAHVSGSWRMELHSGY
jgi:hypothetical protein